MDRETGARDILERMLLDASADPTDMPLSLLKSITNDFSDDQNIGSGGFASVYKGTLSNGTVVAVKRLNLAVDKDEKSFDKELMSLTRLKHNNIVRLLGYCGDTQLKVGNYMGKAVRVENRQRLLCFEFMQNGGLDKYVKDASRRLDWRTCYQIIKGICRGLDYLHQHKIVHLDLKPANILLDQQMVPKIADFGLAKSFDDKQTRAMTSNLAGSVGYMPPEFIDDGKITLKSDIFSLGIIIKEILTGKKFDLKIENVLENWRSRFETSKENTWLEHVKLCAEISIQCTDEGPENRPSARRIMEMLDEIDRRYGYIETGIYTSSATYVDEKSLEMAEMETCLKTEEVYKTKRERMGSKGYTVPEVSHGGDYRHNFVPMTEVIQIRRQAEVVLQEKTEELFRMKRELLAMRSKDITGRQNS